VNDNIVLLDGAVGTSLWEKAQDKVPVWRYNVENPAIVRQLHREMADAGAKIILANTFGANGGAVAKTHYSVEQIVREGVRLCRETVDGRAKVALAVGPLTGLLEPYGDISEDEAASLYAEMIGAGMQEHPDLIFLQTFIDLSMLKIAAACARKYDVPLFCSMSFERVGKTMMGNSVQDMVEELAPFCPDAVGLNCSLGPVLAIPVLRKFRACTDTPLIFKPNAGKPAAPGETAPEYPAAQFAQEVLPAVEAGATYIGGCCGANASYIRTLRDALAKA